ncbi:hypothetical protein D3C72_2374640 [compost metagenome]
MMAFSERRTVSPRWFSSSWLKVTMPICGRERMVRAAVTVERPLSVSPARTGFFHSITSMPGAPSETDESR